MDKKKRTNTYTNKDYLKVIVVSKTKDQAFAFSKIISNNNENNRGVFYSPFNKTNLIVFPRFVSKLDHQATTVAVEGLIIYLENREDFKDISQILNRFGQVPIKVITASFDASDLAREIDAFYQPQTENPRDIVDFINLQDMEEYKKIRGAFQKYDKDGNGTIESSEMHEIARSMGENPDSDEFQKSLYALDLNQDGVLSLKEFIMWWKIGRQNCHALPKVYDLFHFFQNLINKNFNFSEYVESINKLSEEKTFQKSKQKIILRSPGMFKIKSKLELSIAIGADKRLEMATKFLSQFTKNTSTAAKTNWISIYFPLNQGNKKIDPVKAKLLLDDFKEHCLKWGEENMDPAFNIFIKNLVVFETSNSDNSVILAIRLKVDIEDLVKSALNSIIYILQNLQSSNSATWFNLKANSNVDLYDASFASSFHLGDFLDTCEITMEGETFKDQFKALFSAFSDSYQEKFSWIQMFFQPSNIEVDLDCKFSNFSFGNDKNSFLNRICLKGIGKFLDFIKKSIPSELLATASNIEFCLNAFDIFARLKIFTKNTFNEEVKIVS